MDSDYLRGRHPVPFRRQMHPKLETREFWNHFAFVVPPAAREEERKATTCRVSYNKSSWNSITVNKKGYYVNLSVAIISILSHHKTHAYNHTHPVAGPVSAMATSGSGICGPCIACLRRQGFQKLADLAEYSERGEFDLDDKNELELPASSGVESKRGWLDLKMGVALVWAHTYCLLQNGQFELYSTEKENSDVTCEEFQGVVDLCGSLLFAARSNSYIEIRNDIGSFYFKMNSITQFESWYAAH
jgi:hypothetical protein